MVAHIDAPTVPWPTLGRWVKACIESARVINKLLQAQALPKEQPYWSEDEKELIERVSRSAADVEVLTLLTSDKVPALKPEEMAKTWRVLQQFPFQDKQLRMLEDSLVEYFKTWDDPKAIAHELLARIWNLAAPSYGLSYKEWEEKLPPS